VARLRGWVREMGRVKGCKKCPRVRKMQRQCKRGCVVFVLRVPAVPITTLFRYCRRAKVHAIYRYSAIR